jgi:2',3'-cyclic-nucleotide 2'-phosphodiesterase (5'-nucleotidase family)
MAKLPAVLVLVLAPLLLVRAGAPEALLIIAADQHSAYERTAQVVAAIDRLRAEHRALPLAILIDGDAFEYGNVVARRSQGAVDFAMFSALARRGPTVVNLGNHEPEFDDLATTVTHLEATGARIVSNLRDRGTGRLVASPSVRLSLGRNEIVVAGVATDDVSTYREAVRPSLGLSEPVSWAREKFPALLGVAPVKVVLSHAGLKADRGMLPLVPDGTLFAGAHDHLRFVQSFGRTVYVHSGSWNAYLTLAWLSHDASGATRWDVEQIPMASERRADPALASLIRDTRTRYLKPEDRQVVAHVPGTLAPSDAARLIAGALRRGAGVDAAFVGNTTFGGGLPAGDVTREAFDACVRFDGGIFEGAVSGSRLRQLLSAANQDVNTPFDQRGGEFNVADGPATIDDARTYRIVTTDWGAKNSARYFGEPVIAFEPRPGLTLKAVVLRMLAPAGSPR